MVHLRVPYCRNHTDWKMQWNAKVTVHIKKNLVCSSLNIYVRFIREIVVCYR